MGDQKGGQGGAVHDGTDRQTDRQTELDRQRQTDRYSGSTCYDDPTPALQSSPNFDLLCLNLQPPTATLNAPKLDGNEWSLNN